MAIYDLAFQLKMSLDDVLEMPYEQFLGWQAYFAKRPVGWRDDDRAAKLIQAQGVKEKSTSLFPSLQAIYGDLTATNAEGTNMNTLKGSQVFNWMSKASGGDTLNL